MQGWLQLTSQWFAEQGFAVLVADGRGPRSRSCTPAPPSAPAQLITGLFVAAWLAGAAAAWLLWRPASSAFFKPQGFTRALPRHL
jgi:hypothetical protein